MATAACSRKPIMMIRVIERLAQRRHQPNALAISARVEASKRSVPSLSIERAISLPSYTPN